MARLFSILLSLLPLSVAGFAGMIPASNEVSRRDALIKSAFGVLGGLTTLSTPVIAEVYDETERVTTRMGGLLEKYQDPRGWTILAPSGWNKFDGEVGAFDVKWQDLVNPAENVKVSSTPVKSNTTSIDALGDVAALGAKLANKRNAKLVAASERLTDGVLFYEFDFAINDGTHQLLQLSINKGKIWSLDANAGEKRWSKRVEMYKNILGSFMPKLG